MNEEKDVRICPVCEREVERSEMNFTKDCHGIPFRLVCWECYLKLMEKGYDGEYYDESSGDGRGSPADPELVF